MWRLVAHTARRWSPGHAPSSPRSTAAPRPVACATLIIAAPPLQCAIPDEPQFARPPGHRLSPSICMRGAPMEAGAPQTDRSRLLPHFPTHLHPCSRRAHPERPSVNRSPLGRCPSSYIANGKSAQHTYCKSPHRYLRGALRHACISVCVRS